MAETGQASRGVLVTTNWSAARQGLKNGSTDYTGTGRRRRSPGSLPARRPQARGQRGRAASTLPPTRRRTTRLGHLDGTDGLNFYTKYGRLRDLFREPGSSDDKRTLDVLRGYLGAEHDRPAASAAWPQAHPQTATDGVPQKRSCASRTFFTAQSTRGLLRRRKPWYYSTSPVPTSRDGARLKRTPRQ